MKLLILRIILISSLLLLSNTCFSVVDNAATTKTITLWNTLVAMSGTYCYYGYAVSGGYDDGDIWEEEEYKITGRRRAIMQISTENLIDSGFNPRANSIYFRNKYILPYLKKGGILMMFNIPINNYPDWLVSEIMPGGAKRELYLNKMTLAANFIKSLTDDDGSLFPVIVRPFHENDRPWFFWGNTSCTKAEYIALFRDFVTQMRDVQGVHNILYCYCPEFPTPGASFPYGEGGPLGETFNDRYPGDDYVDIIALDRYPRTSSFLDATTQTMLQDLSDTGVLHGKPFGIAESGREIGNYLMSDYWTTGCLNVFKNDAKIKKISFFLTFTSPIYSPLYGRSDSASFIEMVNDSYIRMLPITNIKNCILKNVIIN